MTLPYNYYQCSLIFLSTLVLKFFLMLINLYSFINKFLNSEKSADWRKRWNKKTEGFRDTQEVETYLKLWQLLLGISRKKKCFFFLISFKLHVANITGRVNRYSVMLLLSICSKRVANRTTKQEVGKPKPNIKLGKYGEGSNFMYIKNTFH